MLYHHEMRRLGVARDGDGDGGDGAGDGDGDGNGGDDGKDDGSIVSRSRVRGRKVNVMKVDLVNNYRTHSGVLDCANLVYSLLHNLFPQAVDHMEVTPRPPALSAFIIYLKTSLPPHL